MQLSDFDKSRVRYHLGYFTVSVPAGDYARLEESLNTVPDSFFYDKIIIQIGRCDTAEKKTEVATSPSFAPGSNISLVPIKPFSKESKPIIFLVHVE